MFSEHPPIIRHALRPDYPSRICEDPAKSQRFICSRFPPTSCHQGNGLKEAECDRAVKQMSYTALYRVKR